MFFYYLFCYIWFKLVDNPRKVIERNWKLEYFLKIFVYSYMKTAAINRKNCNQRKPSYSTKQSFFRAVMIFSMIILQVYCAAKAELSDEIIFKPLFWNG